MKYEIIQQSSHPDYSSYIARVGDKCGGEARITYGGTGAAYLDRWIVYPEYRKCGIGRDLLSAAEDWAVSVNAVSILVVFSPDNPRELPLLIRALQKYGYQCSNFAGTKQL